MADLFRYLKNDTDVTIIKSCVFHYEVEFIHPFEDDVAGNNKKTKVANVDYKKRTEHALLQLNERFDRKEYMAINKSISTAHYRC